MLNLLCPEILEGGFVLAKVQGVKEPKGFHGTNLGLLAEVAHHVASSNWFLGANKAQHSSTCRGGCKGRVCSEARLWLHWHSRRATQRRDRWRTAWCHKSINAWHCKHTSSDEALGVGHAVKMGIAKRIVGIAWAQTWASFNVMLAECKGLQHTFNSSTFYSPTSQSVMYPHAIFTTRSSASNGATHLRLACFPHVWQNQIIIYLQRPNVPIHLHYRAKFLNLLCVCVLFAIHNGNNNSLRIQQSYGFGCVVLFMIHDKTRHQHPKTRTNWIRAAMMRSLERRQMGTIHFQVAN